MHKVNFPKPQVHPKVWGEEVWVINEDGYCLKFLKFNAGAKGSLHFHKLKNETWYIQSGEIDLIYVDTEVGGHRKARLTSGEVVNIPQLNPHQVIAITDTVIVEASTTHYETDSYRIFPSSKT